MGDAEKNAGAAKGIQNTNGAVGSDPWYCYLFIHDGVPSNGYMDPFDGMDADRSGYLSVYMVSKNSHLGNGTD